MRLELALLGPLFTIAIKAWGVGLPVNPVLNIRRPSPAPGRSRRLSAAEERKRFAAVDKHANPMLRWIVRIAVETGMRSSEIAALKLSPVEVRPRIVHLLETKNALPPTAHLSKAATKRLREALAHPVRPGLRHGAEPLSELI